MHANPGMLKGISNSCVQSCASLCIWKAGQLSCSWGGEQGFYLLVTLAIILYKTNPYSLQLMGLHGDNSAVSVPQLCTPTRTCCCILHSGTEP